MFGVEPERKVHPAGTEHDGPGFPGTQIDAQRLFKGRGGDLSMGAKPRPKAGGGQGVTLARPGAFAVRRRTQKHYK
jgi:hypothetical protein